MTFIDIIFQIITFFSFASDKFYAPWTTRLWSYHVALLF